MEGNCWWQKSVRIIQYNLQVADTALMDPHTIAEDLMHDYANAVVLNVGGIYAWYQSTVKYHNINEYLPKGRDLLAEIIAACHERKIKVIARFDFSKAVDTVFLNRPDYFVKMEDGLPLIYGKERMGNWSLLLSTCVNGGYRNHEVAAPVIKEVLEQYEIDGIFFNAPQAEFCWCERCRKKYKMYYRKALPEKKEDFESDWRSRCLKDNIRLLNEAAKGVHSDIPLILYYSGYDFTQRGVHTVDDLDQLYKSADLICTEAQDVLSGGVKEVNPMWKPYLNMKIGNAVPGYPRPFGIIHSCPGMDWRHSGLPEAEYMFWMAEVMAANANIWHSVTGFNETIADKRIPSAIHRINERIQVCEKEMEGAASSSQVLLLWNATKNAAGWVEGMCANQYPFDLMDVYHLELERMKEYPITIVPSGFNWNEELIETVTAYTKSGGCLVIEKNDDTDFEKLKWLMGIEKDVTVSTVLAACYFRFEKQIDQLLKGLKEAVFIPLRGRVAYSRAKENTEVLATFVPPFAPLDAVGAPPERASMPVSHTELPMLMLQPFGKGKVLTLTFSLSELVLDYHLADHYLLLRNCLDFLLGDAKEFQMKENVAGILASVYHNGKSILVHLINGIGQRPLINPVPYYNACFTVRIPEGMQINKVSSVIEQEEVTYLQQDNKICVNLKKLNIWNMIYIEIGRREALK